MCGVIDPYQPERSRIDRLERVLAEILPTLDRSVLSPEAQQILREADIRSARQEQREQRSLRERLDHANRPPRRPQ